MIGLKRLVEQVNAYEDFTVKLKDSEFPKKTEELKNKIKQGSKIDQLLPEAFSLVREASKRVRNERHFDVQILGELFFMKGKLLK